MNFSPSKIAVPLLVTTAMAVAPAGAQAPARPTPTACSGVSFTDPAGDADLGTLASNNGAPPSGQKPPENHDVVGGFFRYAPDGTGANVLTANIVVANLDKSVQPGAVGVEWLMRWTFGGDTYSAAAEYNQATDTLSASAGPTALDATSVETTATMFEGKEGIVSIVIPVKDPAMGGMDGKSITSTHAWTKVDFDSVAPNVDEAPDDESGKAFKVVPCAQGATPTPGTGAPPVTPPPPPAASGPATLALKVSAGRPKARTVSKKKGFTVTLQAGEALTGISAKLVSGKKVVGTGKLSSLTGKGKLKLKVPRKVRKGSYTLTLSARKKDGRTASTSVGLRLG